MSFDLRPCLSGDKQAWDAFVKRFCGVIYAAVAKTLRAGAGQSNPEDLRDVVQDVFLRLLEGNYRLLRRYDPARSSLVTYLTLIARSVALDHLRRRRPTTSLEDRPADSIAARADPPPEPLELPAGLLSVRERLVLHMLFDRQMTVAEAARTLAVKAQTIRSMKHKAIAKLRAHYGRS